MVDMNEIKLFWEERGMTYGSEHGGITYIEDGEKIEVEKGSRLFFKFVDKTFFKWNRYLHNENGYFGALFPYGRYKGKRILEIGCGMGTHLSLWSQNNSVIVGIDITKNAVSQTKRRLSLEGLKGTLINASADNLPFPDESFDYIYSWGVLHHIPTFREAFSEIERVLIPGGEIGIMLYHKHSFNHWFYTLFNEAFIHLEGDFLSEIELTSRYGDDYRREGNPYTKVFTAKELLNKYFPNFHNKKCTVFGATDVRNIFSIMIPGFAKIIPEWICHTLGKFWGWSIWFSGTKR